MKTKEKEKEKTLEVIEKVEAGLRCLEEYSKGGQHNQLTHGRGGSSSGGGGKTRSARAAASEKKGLMKKGKLTAKGILHLKKRLKGKVSPAKIDQILKRSGLLAKGEHLTAKEIAWVRSEIDELGIDPKTIIDEE